MPIFAKNYLYELPDDIQALIYKKVFKNSLKIINDKKEAINNFNRLVASRCAFRNNIFDKVCIINNNLAINYNASLIKKELDKLSAIIEDKKNVINLAMLNEKLNEKNDINIIILMIIYDNLVSADGDKKYQPIMNKLGVSNQLQRTAHILSA